MFIFKKLSLAGFYQDDQGNGTQNTCISTDVGKIRTYFFSAT
jgi:hypothetical protein